MLTDDPVLLKIQNHDNKQSLIKYLENIISELKNERTQLRDFKCHFENKLERIDVGEVSVDMELYGRKITMTVDYDL